MNDDYLKNQLIKNLISQNDSVNKDSNYFIFTKKFWIYFVIIVVIGLGIFYIYYHYYRPKWYEKIYSQLKQFKGFKYSHLTNQEDEEKIEPPITNTNCHFLIFGSSGSGKTSFLKYYLDQTKSDYLVFGRDPSEFKNYADL